MFRQYAVVYREKETLKLIRETGLTFEEAQKRQKDTHGAIHKMNGVKSFKIA